MPEPDGMSGPPRLPAVRLRPVAELAPLVRDTAYLRGAEQLARWADGKHLTNRGGLRAADARAAAKAVRLPPAVRRAFDFGGRPADPTRMAVEQLWETVVGAELVELEDRDGSRYARPGPAVRLLDEADRGEADPEEVLDVWGDLLEVAAARVPTGLATLLVLYLSPEPLSLEELTDEVLASPLSGLGVSGALAHLVRDTTRRITDQLLDVLAELDAVESVRNGVRLTDLGRYGANGIFAGSGFEAPFVTDLREASAQEAFEVADREVDPVGLMTEWLAVRPVRDAVEELLALAAAAGPVERSVGFALLERVDAEQAAPAVRAALDVPPLRAYAISWLTVNGFPAPEIEPDEVLWIAVDALAAEIEGSGGDEGHLRRVVPTLLGGAGSVEDQAAAVTRMGDCDHPDIVEVLDAIHDYHRSWAIREAAQKALAQARTGRPGGDISRASRAATAYQIKITLRGVRPPVWRRLVIPGSLTLAELHRVIQVAMGWTDTHLHEFEVGGARYGVPDDDFGWGEPVRPETEVRLDEVAEQGAKIRYTYDFGDDWEHDVVVEEVRAPLPGERLPVCLAGRRACPPEDVGGPPGYENFLAAYGDPSHPEHEEYRTWVGGLHVPREFDCDETTWMLQGEG